MSVIVATAYMDEAQGFDWLVAMDDGKVLATGTPAELMQKHVSLTGGCLHWLAAGNQAAWTSACRNSAADDGRHAAVAIEAQNLTMRFGDFVAVDHVSFRIGAARYLASRFQTVAVNRPP
jgi:ribosome-dependent ATPase